MGDWQLALGLTGLLTKGFEEINRGKLNRSEQCRSNCLYFSSRVRWIT